MSRAPTQTGILLLAAAVAALGMVPFAFSEWALSVFGIPHQAWTSASLIGASYLLIGALLFSRPFFAEKPSLGLVFAALSLFSLSLMSVIYFGKISETLPLGRGVVTSWEQLRPEQAVIDPHLRYIMDGAIDEWIYVLYRNGPFAVPFSVIGVNEKGILYLYSVALWLLGDFNTYLLVVLNWAAHVLSALLLFAMTSRYVDRRAAALAAGCLLVFPENLFWGGMLFKDNMVVLLVLAALYSVLRIVIDGARRYYALLLPVLYGIVFLRSGLLVALMVAGLFSMVLARRRPLAFTFEYVTLMVAGTLAFALIFPSSVVQEVGTRSFGFVYDRLLLGTSRGADVQNITYRTSKQESVVEKVGGGSLSLANTYMIPVRVAMYAYSPFPPWRARFDGDRYIIPSTWAIMLSLLFFGAAALRTIVTRDPPTSIMLVFMGGLVAAIAFAGPLVYERYRMMLSPIYLAFAALSWVNLPATRRTLLALGSLLVLALVYLAWRLLR